MKFPRFGADLKEGLLQLFIGSASLQGFLFLLLDDGLSIFESGWQISLAVSLLYCLIPCAMVAVWALFLRSKDNKILSTDSGFGHLKFWQILIISSSALAVGLTIHIFSEFESDVDSGTEKVSIWVTILAIVLVLSMVGTLLVQTIKNRRRKSTIKNESIKIDFEKATKALNMEALVVVLVMAFGAIFVFQNTHIDLLGKDDHGAISDEHGKNLTINGENENEYNFRHSNMPDSQWDSPIRKKPLSTETLIGMLRTSDALLLELEAGKKYTKLLFSNRFKSGELTQSDPRAVIDALLCAFPDSAALGISAVYMKEFGPNRSLTDKFEQSFNSEIERLKSVNAQRAEYFKNDWPKQTEAPTQNLTVEGYNELIEDELAELALVKSIVKSDLKYHLKDKIMIIQFDVAVVLSVYFLIAMLLWYVFSLRSITLSTEKAEEDSREKAPEEKNPDKKTKEEKDSDPEGALGQASYFKNMSMYLIILFLPLLKFDAESTDVLEHPFWNITWSDVASSGTNGDDAAGDGIDIYGPIVTTLDVEALMAKIEALSKTDGLTKKDLEEIEDAMDEINVKLRKIRQHQQ